VVLEFGGLVGGHVEFVVECVAGDGDNALGTGGLGVDEDGGAVEGEAVALLAGETVLFDAATDLDAVE